MAIRHMELTTDDHLRSQITTFCERNSRPHVVVFVTPCPVQRGEPLRLACTTLGGTAYLVEVASDSGPPGLARVVLLSRADLRHWVTPSESSVSLPSTLERFCRSRMWSVIS